MKQIIIGALVVFGIIGAAVMFGKDDTATTGTTSNYVYGKADAKVTLVEFGDFECPACGFFFPVVQEVKEKYKDQIAFQFRHFPLVQIHRNALASHRAAEAAGKQGKFYEMHDLLYQNQESWNGPSGSDSAGVTTEQAISYFEQYAERLQLDMDKYRADVNDSSTIATINADTAEGKSKYSISGTPTFILNGKIIEDTSTIDTVEEFSALIDKALEETGSNTSETTEETAKEPETTQTEQ